MSGAEVTAVWRCPACGFEHREDAAWSFMDYRDEHDVLIAETHSCPRCLIQKLTALLPQMVRVEEA